MSHSIPARREPWTGVNASRGDMNINILLSCGQNFVKDLLGIKIHGSHDSIFAGDCKKILLSTVI